MIINRYYVDNQPFFIGANDTKRVQLKLSSNLIDRNTFTNELRLAGIMANSIKTESVIERKDIIERYVDTIFNNSNLRQSFETWLNQWFPEFLHSPNSKVERADVRDSFTDFIGTKHRLINNDTEETEPQGQNGEAQNLAIYRYEIYQAYLVFNMASVQNIILSSIKTKLEKLILTFCDQRRSSTYTGYITFVNILSNIVKVSSIYHLKS